jgi:Tfp pilus assembly protein PilO
MILAHSLWEVPEQKEIVLDVIKEHAQDRVTTMLETFKQELKEQLKIANSKQITTEAIIEATQKLKGLEGNLKMLAEQNPDRADVLALLKEVQEHRQGMAKNILAI